LNHFFYQTEVEYTIFVLNKANMKILIIGGTGTIGKKVAATFKDKHEVIIAGRSTLDVTVDISDAHSIEAMYKKVGKIDACICTAGTGFYGPFENMTGADMMPGIGNKLLGQVNLVLIGKNHLNEGGSFTLTSGIAAEHPARKALVLL
jgi:NAD(P)-dependent dehydrogenase (short-subunit alcohol dehydrogenase family)